MSRVVKLFSKLLPAEKEDLSPLPILRWEILALVIILLVGTGLRAVYLTELLDNPSFDTPLLDSQFWDYWARGLVSGEWNLPTGMNDPRIPSVPFLRPPGYPYFLAAVYWLFDGSFLAVRIVQMVTGLAGAVLAWLFVRGLFGRAVGLIAAAFMATYWIFIFYEGGLNAPAMVIFLLMVMLNFIRLWRFRVTFLRAFLPGVALSALIVTRPEMQFFFVVVLGWFGWTCIPRRAWKAWVKAALCFTCGAAVLITIATVRNYRVSGEVIPIAGFGGINLHVSNNELSDGAHPVADYERMLGIVRRMNVFDWPLIYQAIAEKLDKPDLTFAEGSAYYRSVALEYIREHPWITLERVGKKVLLFWGPAETSNNTIPHVEKEHSALLRYMPGIPFVLALFWLGLGAWLYHLARPATATAPLRDKTTPLLVGLLVMVYFGSLLPFFVAARYRAHVTPLMLCFAAYGAHHLWVCMKRPNPRALVWATVAAVLLAWFHIDWVDYDQPYSLWHSRRGDMYMIRKEYDEALNEYLASFEDPDKRLENPPTRAGLMSKIAAIYREKGDYDEALDWFEKSVDTYPALPNGQTGLAQEYHRAGRHEEAIRHYQAAIVADRFYTPAYDNLGNLLAELGQPEEAIKQYEQVVSIEPRDPYVHYNWATALADLGRYREALDKLQDALRVNPQLASDPEFQNQLGITHALLGNLEAAAGCFRRAAELKPGWPVALNNFGKAMLRQGQVQEAMLPFKQAIESAPQDYEGHYNLGVAYSKIDKNEEAATAFRKALELEPGKPEIYTALAAELAALREPDAALGMLQTALQIDPDYPPAHIVSIDILGKLGRYPEALAHAERLKDLVPRGDEILNDIRSKLKKGTTATP